MQRCCARIARLRTFGSLQRSRRFPTLSTRQYARHARDLDFDQSVSAPSPEADFDTLIGADHEAEAYIEGDGQGGLRGPSRQYWTRRANALNKGGFAYIDSSKLPARADANRIKAWMPIIEAALPKRLRDSSTALRTDQTFSPQDISRIIHISSCTYRLDLLNHLAVDLNRWNAAVWLVTQIVKHDFKPDPPPPRNASVWSTHLPSGATFENTTSQARGVFLKSTSKNDSPHLRPPPSLDQMTDELHPHHEPLSNILRHETLGQIWESLGNMIIADAARANKDSTHQAIKPEILQIIAMLHHNGAMPSSIYSYQPADDSVSLQQPPTLHLLSSQIITSLTDAAWRAHELTVVEEAKEKGGVYEPLRPEIPGSMYKVHVAGLGHEIWLELVLWACLYGRFYVQGASILRSLADQKNENAWSVLSWRELANPIIQSGQEKSINWDEVKYIFNTGVSNADQTVNKKKVRRTVSAELVASFVDAVVSQVRTGVGSRGIYPEYTARFLGDMKGFLRRNDMSLGFTSWDAIILRFFESKGIDFDTDPTLARKVTYLSSQFGDDLAAVNAPTRDQLWQSTPPYVLDGTAATIGHLHRLMRAHIRLGSLRGALQNFESLQKVTDRNKEKSIELFFASHQHDEPEHSEDSESFGFEGRYGGIHYPNFYPQIPTPILADFLDLAVDANALEFASWLVYSKDVDGPLIHKRLYGDPIMGPALVRLAAVLGDKDLMAKVFENQRRYADGDTPKQILTALLEHQIEAQNWTFVNRALEKFAKLPGYSISTNTTAVVIRMILREAKLCDNDFEKLEASETSKMFQKLVSMRPPQRATKEFRKSQGGSKFVELSGRIWRLLALVNDDWRDYAWKAYPKLHGRAAVRFITRPFNIILGAILDAYGFETGKQFLGKLWPDALKKFSSRELRSSSTPGGVPRMASRREYTPILTSPYADSKYGEHRIRIEGPDDRRAILTVDLRTRPNIATIQLVLQQALDEHEGHTDLIRQDAEWARQMMKRLGLKDSYIRAELRGLPVYEYHHEVEDVEDRRKDDIKDILSDDLDNESDELDEMHRQESDDSYGAEEDDIKDESR